MKLTKKALCSKFSAAATVSATVIGNVVTADEWPDVVQARVAEGWALASSGSNEWLKPPEGLEAFRNVGWITKRAWLRKRIGRFYGSSTGEFWFESDSKRSFARSIDLVVDAENETLSLTLMKDVVMVYRIVEVTQSSPSNPINAVQH